MRLKGKVAIVAGGSRGLGCAYAERLAKEGAKVVVADILDGKKTVDAIVQQGGEAIYVQTDVTSEKSAQEMARKSVERFGRIDILINNAGILLDSTFAKTDERKWDAVIAVHLKGPIA
jgi:NAD(P)-dependent dehydrogenase (short-subunit alcohol dehydrogenase family)